MCASMWPNSFLHLTSLSWLRHLPRVVLRYDPKMRRSTKAILRRAVLSMSFVMLAAALTSCASTQDRSTGTVVQGRQIQLRMQVTERFWAEEIRRTAVELAKQSAGDLDSPLEFDLLFRPGQLSDGEVSVRFAVSPEGRVIDVQVLRVAAGLGREVLVREMLRTLHLWRFFPPMLSGKPVGYCCVELTLELFNPRS